MEGHTRRDEGGRLSAGYPQAGKGDTSGVYEKEEAPVYKDTMYQETRVYDYRTPKDAMYQRDRVYLEDVGITKDSKEREGVVSDNSTGEVDMEGVAPLPVTPPPPHRKGGIASVPNTSPACYRTGMVPFLSDSHPNHPPPPIPETPPPLPGSDIPRSPLPGSDIPRSPLPGSDIPRSPLPGSEIPRSPLLGSALPEDLAPLPVPVPTVPEDLASLPVSVTTVREPVPKVPTSALPGPELPSDSPTFVPVSDVPPPSILSDIPEFPSSAPIRMSDVAEYPSSPPVPMSDVPASWAGLPRPRPVLGAPVLLVPPLPLTDSDPVVTSDIHGVNNLPLRNQTSEAEVSVIYPSSHTPTPLPVSDIQEQLSETEVPQSLPLSRGPSPAALSEAPVSPPVSEAPLPPLVSDLPPPIPLSRSGSPPLLPVLDLPPLSPSGPLPPLLVSDVPSLPVSDLPPPLPVSDLPPPPPRPLPVSDLPPPLPLTPPPCKTCGQITPRKSDTGNQTTEADISIPATARGRRSTPGKAAMSALSTPAFSGDTSKISVTDRFADRRRVLRRKTAELLVRTRSLRARDAAVKQRTLELMERHRAMMSPSDKSTGNTSYPLKPEVPETDAIQPEYKSDVFHEEETFMDAKEYLQQQGDFKVPSISCPNSPLYPRGSRGQKSWRRVLTSSRNRKSFPMVHSPNRKQLRKALYNTSTPIADNRKSSSDDSPGPGLFLRHAQCRSAQRRFRKVADVTRSGSFSARVTSILK